MKMTYKKFRYARYFVLPERTRYTSNAVVWHRACGISDSQDANAAHAAFVGTCRQQHYECGSQKSPLAWNKKM